MIGYRRIVKTLGERLGREHLVPALRPNSSRQVPLVLPESAGYPLSTTHVVTGGIAGTRVASGAGLHRSTVSRIVLAWVLTLTRNNRDVSTAVLSAVRNLALVRQGIGPDIVAELGAERTVAAIDRDHILLAVDLIGHRC